MLVTRFLATVRLSLGGSILAIAIATLVGKGGYQATVVAAVIGFLVAATFVVLLGTTRQNPPA
jgi:hypothetical protein